MTNIIGVTRIKDSTPRDRGQHMTIVNTRIFARDLRVGDTFIVTHAPDSPNRYSVVAQVRDIIPQGKQHLIVFYGACDDPSGLAYGSDVTLRRSDKVTKVDTLAATIKRLADR